MNIEDIKNELNSTKYDFLRNDKNLGDNIILLTTGGSYAYGTNVETSDIDIRGICIETKQNYWGLTEFEQFEDKPTDTVIYGLRKIIQLLMNCNPNVLEILGTTEDQIFKINKAGRLLKDNLDIFLSKKAIHSFGGYATAQLRRLQNALARGVYDKTEKEKHILESINRQFNHFEENYKKFGFDELKLYLDKSNKKDFDQEIHIDLHLNNYPLRDLKAIMNDMTNVIKDYESLNHRNNKKDEIHLNKHAMHLIRLLIMGIEVLEGKGVNTNRKNDLILLMQIRNGLFSYEDIFDLVDEYESKFKEASRSTKLKDRPSRETVEKLMIEIYEMK